MKALNSPIGKLTECLLELQGEPKKAKAPPRFVTDRLNTLFQLPGYGAGHAVCTVARRMGWLDYYYPEWTRSTLVPLFSLDNSASEAAWHGRAYDRNGLSPDTCQDLVPFLLKVLSGTASWKLNDQEFRQHVQSLVSLSHAEQGVPLISFSQARGILNKLDEKGLTEALNALLYFVEKGEWAKFVKPFIKEAWPRALKFKSQSTSRSFTRLLNALGADYPDGVETVLPFLIPVPHVDVFTYRMVKGKDTEQTNLAATYPSETLKVLSALVADDRSTMPYGLGQILEVIGEAKPSLKQAADWRRLQDLAG